MSGQSPIEWTDATWNPTVGCSLVSPGCTHCYAMRLAHRLALMGSAKYQGLTEMTKAGAVWTGEVRVDEAALDQPLRWRRPRRIFVNSMSDLFHESLPDEAIHQVFGIISNATHHTYQILTKRAERMRNFMRAYSDVLKCVWLGVSVEDQARADERIPHLLETPAAVRFLSCEPLLGPVNLAHIRERLAGESFQIFDALNHPDTLSRGRCRQGVDWVIAGGESGPDARPMHPDWARSLRDQCAAAEVPFFFKQWGEHFPFEFVERGKDGEIWRTGCNAARIWFFDELNAPQPDAVRFSRVGKKAAGAVLDGREHRAFPEIRA